METRNQGINMTSAFFVIEEYSKKEKVNAFVQWLEQEGYQEVKHEHYNLYGAFYIDIASMTYAKANADAMLVPIIGNQGIKYDDYKVIHNVYMNRKADEKTWRFRPAYLVPFAWYMRYKESIHTEFEEDRRLYFERNISFEEWCEDIFKCIKADRWYFRNLPNYSKADFQKTVENRFIHRDLEEMYNNHEMPSSVAGQWYLITF